MSDLIDRNAALDAIKFAELGCEYDEVKKVPIFNPWHRVEDDPPDEKKDAIFYYEWTGISGTVYKETSIISLNELIVLGCRPIEWMEIPERREPLKEDA